MRRFGKLIYLFVLILFLPSCEGTTWQSSVPAYPVNVIMNTYQEFTDFNTFTDYVVVTPDGYFRKEKLIPVKSLLAGEACGYGGVVVYISMNGYDAFDLACPYCAGRGQKCPCVIDGLFATCPNCGEKYDLSSGTAAPQNGIAKEPMRQLKVLPITDGKITVKQK